MILDEHSSVHYLSMPYSQLGMQEEEESLYNKINCKSINILINLYHQLVD